MLGNDAMIHLFNIPRKRCVNKGRGDTVPTSWSADPGVGQQALPDLRSRLELEIHERVMLFDQPVEA